MSEGVRELQRVNRRKENSLGVRRDDCDLLASDIRQKSKNLRLTLVTKKIYAHVPASVGKKVYEKPRLCAPRATFKFKEGSRPVALCPRTDMIRAAISAPWGTRRATAEEGLCQMKKPEGRVAALEVIAMRGRWANSTDVCPPPNKLRMRSRGRAHAETLGSKV